MRLKIDDINNDERIPERFALGVSDPIEHARPGPNINPAISWGDLPEGTRSLALICVDTDVPSKPDDVNQEGRLVPSELPRVNFYHWVMVDIPPTVDRIEEGACSSGITAGGKTAPPGPEGSRQGLNDYTNWFAGDPDMGGKYFGYDGPWPPWNDSLLHHYHFILYALDLDQCPVAGDFTGPDVEKAIEGHVLGQIEIVGTYSLNPDV